MAVVIRNDPDLGFAAEIPFLAAQDQHVQQQRAIAEEEQRRRQEEEQQQLAALAQAANSVPQLQFAQPQQMPPQPVIMPSGPSPGPSEPAQVQPQAFVNGQPVAPDHYASQRHGHGGDGASFLAAQAQAMGVSDAAAAHAMGQAAAAAATQQSLAQRAAIAANAKLQQQQAAALNQQRLAELNANLRQRDKLMQTAPGILDPAQISEAQAKISANQQALTYPARVARQKLMNAIATGDPQAIQEGVAQGLLAFSPEQQTRQKQIREAMSQLDTDPNISPSQRAIGERVLAEKLNAIRPMEVPSDQQPIDPIEQFHRDTITMPDQTSGLPLTYHKSIRNGEETWRLDDASKESLKTWQQKEVEKWKLDNGMHHEDMKAKAFDRDLTSWKADMPKPPKTSEFQKVGADGIWEPDQTAYDKAVKEYKQQFNDWKARKPLTEREMMQSQAGTATDPTSSAMADMGMVGDQSAPSAPDVTDPQASAMADMGMGDINPTQDMEAMSLPPVEMQQQAPQVLSPHDDGQQQWQSVPIGGTTTLPDGTPVKKTGPTSYVRL